MPKRKNPRADFNHEKVIRTQKSGNFFLDTREIRLNIYPTRLRVYPLAIGFTKQYDPKIAQVYRDEFMSRIEYYAEEACLQSGLSFEILRPVLKINLEVMIRRALSAKYKREDYILIRQGELNRPLTASEKEMNSSIFLARFRDALNLLVANPGTKKACEDYGLVCKAREDMDLFPEVVKLCRGSLEDFVQNKHVKGIDRDSQRQEGLLAIWSGVKDYEARNFARFNTFAKGVLHFKFLNLLRFSQADKRRVNRRLVDLGDASGAEDSYFAHLLERFSFEGWEQQQTIYDAVNSAWENGNGRTGELEFAGALNGDEGARKVLLTLLHGNPSRQITQAEINADRTTFSKAYVKRVGQGKKVRSSIDEEARYDKPGKQDEGGFWKTEKVVVNEENFPHLNEFVINPIDFYSSL
ncbi:MAG: hypothetical protein AABW80_03485 [Nanoarchaeota archaeon]